MITKEENLKIRQLMSAIESMAGVNIPYSTGVKLAGIYNDLETLLGKGVVSEG